MLGTKMRLFYLGALPGPGPDLPALFHPPRLLSPASYQIPQKSLHERLL